MISSLLLFSNTIPGQSAELRGLPSQAIPAHFGWHDKQLKQKRVILKQNTVCTHCISVSFLFSLYQSPGRDGPMMRPFEQLAGGGGHMLRFVAHLQQHFSELKLGIVVVSFFFLRINALWAAIILIVFRNDLRDASRPYYNIPIR